MNPILSFLKLHWKKILVGAVAIILGVGLFFGGRASVPEAKVTEKLVLRTEFQDREVRVEVARELTREEMQKIRDEVRNEQRRTEIHEVTKPDGTKTRDVVSTVGIVTTTKEQEIKYVDRVVEKTVYVDRVVTKEVEKLVTKVIEPPPRKIFEISAMAALDPTAVKLSPAIDFPVMGGGLIQVHPQITLGPLTIPLSFGAGGAGNAHNGLILITAGLEF